MIQHFSRSRVSLLAVSLLVLCAAPAVPMQGVSARDRAFYTAVEHAHVEAMRIADAKYPQIGTPGMSKAYRDQALKNSAQYDHEFTRLMKPATVKFHMTEDQLSEIFENVSVQIHARH